MEQQYNIDALEETVKFENGLSRKKNELITLIVVFLVIYVAMILESKSTTYCASDTANCLPRAGAILVMFALFGAATSYYIQSREKIATNTYLYTATLPKDPNKLMEHISVPEGETVSVEMAERMLEHSKQRKYYQLREIYTARIFSTDFAIIQFIVAAFGTFVWGFGDLEFGSHISFAAIVAL